MNDVILMAGKEWSLLRHHPRVFSGAVAKLSGKTASGETVRAAVRRLADVCQAYNPARNLRKK